jgi:hypothetical protein
MYEYGQAMDADPGVLTFPDAGEQDLLVAGGAALDAFLFLSALVAHVSPFSVIIDFTVASLSGTVLPVVERTQTAM